MRQVVLDTETTGLQPEAGDRIIEIGCVELVDRKFTEQTFQRYINPERAVGPGALEVHGIDDEFLATQPLFEDVAEEFMGFVQDAELIIHNADFDIGFINHELRRLETPVQDIREHCRVLDTLTLARRMHPGQHNSLDALAKRYQVDNSHRKLHGALLDAGILAEVYLAMTGGQTSLALEGDSAQATLHVAASVDRDGLALTVLKATDAELDAHRQMVRRLSESAGAPLLWEEIEPSGATAPAGEPATPQAGAPEA